MTLAKIVIHGGNPLAGTVTISGAKNAALPILAASCLSDSVFRLANIPQVEDVRVMREALRQLGSQEQTANQNLEIRLANLHRAVVPSEIVKTTRASILLLGPLLARAGQARVSFPGGCSIGERQINFHLEGLQQMGATIDLDDDYIQARCRRLNGIVYRFPNKTVTGTENLLMAATLADGQTVLQNCAVEPEVTDLVDLLTKMGARIRGRGGDVLEIEGRSHLKGCSHTIIPDRIEAGTYVIAGCFPGNQITIANGVGEHIASLLEILRRIGVGIECRGDTITIHATDQLRPLDVITAPYPGFPTDLQAQLTTLLTQAVGTSSVCETIFNDRFKHVGELNRLGAHIQVQGDTARITGPTRLHGAVIKTTDLRASAALVLGGLIAEGETVIENCYQLFRGYQEMPGKLQKLGADITIMAGD